MSDRQQALKVLGLAEGATDEDIRLAYKRLSMKWHPDKNQGSSEATHMMQQLNAAKDKLGQDEDYSDEVEYESDGYYESDEYEDGDYYDDDPFSGPTMNFAAFLRMYARMREAGQIDDYGDYVPTSKPRGTRGGDYCYCPECMRMRRVNKDADRQARREQAWRWRMEQEAEAAEARAQEEADRRLQQTDPKASIAWKKGGEHRERVIREHFLRQTPRLLLHAASEGSLTLVLDAPDLSLLDGKLPPKGVEWEVSYSSSADKKWTNLLATREYDNILLTKLRPGTEYSIKVRTGLAGNHTWSGTPDWGPWGAPQKFKTSGEARHAAGSGSSSSGGLASKGSKKKKNRDAAFAAMFSKRSDDGGEGAEEDEEAEEQDDEQQAEQDASDDASDADEAAAAAEQQELDDSEAAAAAAAAAEDSSSTAVDAAAPAADGEADAAAAENGGEQQQQQEVQQAPVVPKKGARIPPLCVYWQQGKCRYGASCKFRHMVLPGVDDATSPTAAAAADSESLDGDAEASPAAAAARARKDVDALDRLMAMGVGNMTLARAAEAARLCNRAAAYVPHARYQPAPINSDGAYLKPLFLTAYNVVDNSYAAWYRDMVQGGGVRRPRSEAQQQVQQKLTQAMADPEPTRQQQQQPARSSRGPSPTGASAGQHQQQHGKPHNSLYRTKPCKNFALGQCRYGDRCTSLHEGVHNVAAGSGGGSSSGGGSHAPQQQQQQHAAPAAVPVPSTLLQHKAVAPQQQQQQPPQQQQYYQQQPQPQYQQQQQQQQQPQYQQTQYQQPQQPQQYQYQQPQQQQQQHYQYQQQQQYQQPQYQQPAYQQQQQYHQQQQQPKQGYNPLQPAYQQQPAAPAGPQQYQYAAPVMQPYRPF